MEWRGVPTGNFCTGTASRRPGDNPPRGFLRHELIDRYLSGSDQKLSYDTVLGQAGLVLAACSRRQGATGRPDL